MASIALKRLQREFVDSAKELSDCGIKMDLMDGKLNDLLCEIAGPPDTPYAGGTFKIHIKVPETYPFNPPHACFVTKVWHPNISSKSGAICLDILKEKWAAAMTIRTVLLSIQALLAAPEPSDPLDALVSRQYRDHHNVFKFSAKYWTKAFANGPLVYDRHDDMVNKLIGNGMSKFEAVEALSVNDWDVYRTYCYIQFNFPQYGEGIE